MTAVGNSSVLDSSKAPAILSWLPMEISVSVFVCGRWSDAAHMGEEVI